jgi:hypothetical protein
MIAMLCRVLESGAGREVMIYYAVGNTIFCWLLPRAAMIPAPLARLGVVASAALSVLILVQICGCSAAACPFNRR